MQIITTKIILLILFLCGLLLLYRAFQIPSNLTKIETKFIDKKLEIISTHNGNQRYGLTLRTPNSQDKLGIYLGTYDQASQNLLIKEIDTVSEYTILVDPTVSIANGVNLGVKKITLGRKTIYKESNKLNLFGGLIFTTLACVCLFIISNNKRTKKAS